MSQTPCPDRSRKDPRKTYGGSSPYHRNTLYPSSQKGSNSSEDNSNEEKEDTFIGRSLLRSFREVAEEESSPFSDPRDTMSQQEAAQLLTTCGKKKPEFKTRSSNSGGSRSKGTPNQTGMQYVLPQPLEILEKYPATYTFVVTTNCVQLAKTIYNQLLWSGDVQFSGGKLRLASQDELGERPVYRVIQRIQTPSSGMVTRVTNMWLSMNLEVELTSLTCSNGLIDIRSSWKLKDPRLCCEPNIFG